MVRTALLLVVAMPLALGCPGPATALARARDAAQEFNLDTRFGRNDVAIDRVASSAREEFMAHHRAWGTTVRLADVEVAGMHAMNEHDVEVTVHATWYRPEEQELRATTLKQRWQDEGGWKLVAEQRLDGDVGLLGETVIRETPREEAPPARFPTVRLLGEAP